MSSKLRIDSYNTDHELYASLARMFGEDSGGNTRWVKFEHDGVELCFFSPREAVEVEES